MADAVGDYPLAVELDAPDMDRQVVHDLARVTFGQSVVRLQSAVRRSSDHVFRCPSDEDGTASQFALTNRAVTLLI
jgi:hypothetical protein